MKFRLNVGLSFVLILLASFTVGILLADSNKTLGIQAKSGSGSCSLSNGCNCKGWGLENGRCCPIGTPDSCSDIGSYKCIKDPFVSECTKIKGCSNGYWKAVEWYGTVGELKSDPRCKPEKTPIYTPVPTQTLTPTPTPTPTKSPYPTKTPHVTKTPSSTPHFTKTPHPTKTPLHTPTITPTSTPNHCPADCRYEKSWIFGHKKCICKTPTPTPTLTSTSTPTVTPTHTATPSTTQTPTSTSTSPQVLGETAPPILPKTGGSLVTAISLFGMAGAGTYLFRRFRLV